MRHSIYFATVFVDGSSAFSPDRAADPVVAPSRKKNPALSFAEQEKSAATRRAYRSDRQIFAAWCSARDLRPLPAASETVDRFLSSQAAAGVKASTIGRRCAAIGY